MWIAEVNFPESLLGALESARLVVFAGAGVSAGPPSSLPLFAELATSIAAGSLAPEEGEPTDRFLGRLAKRGVRVHHIAREIIGLPASRPSSLHRDLLQLFPDASQVRLVTTNFDRHFSTPADDLFAGQPVEHFFAPALPLGHRFAGIVHLHGSVRPASSDLVLTDEDFGRAYLTEGWARRFLRAMFDQYTILFVGYSHDDLVMTYLARGLPPDPSPRRFVLTGRADDPRWHFLGILPISYPLTPEPDRHRSLEVAVARWAERSRLGFLDHDQQIRAVVQGSPPLDREPADYIAHILTDPSTARIFVRHAEAPDWLRWVEGQGFLRPLFGLATRVEESAEILADWIASNFVTTHPEAGLSLIQRNGLQLNPVLWNAVGFHSLETPAGDLFRHLLSVGFDPAVGRSHDYSTSPNPGLSP